PVRDPFFMMLRRSLNTFMNAFTSSDCTAYPFATQNRKDFDNLLSVYLDAVFFPILDPLDFDQEGWRLDFNEDETGLIYKGVVYNEMKGAMSSPVAQLWQHLSTSLFPDTIYAHNSGGDPLAITDLHYENLKAFHSRHYHPSQAVFMTYGCFSADEHQQLISDRVLARFDAAEVISHLPSQAPFEQPARLNVPYEVGAELDTQRKTHALWAWVLGETASPKDFLQAQLLSAVLLDNSASPLRYLLETTELADAPSELCGLDDSAKQLVLAVGVEGTDEQNVREIETQISSTLEELIESGVEHAVVEGILDNLEMSQRDIGGNSYPLGLQLMSRMLPAFVYNKDPKTLLALDAEIEALRERAKEPSFVPTLIKQYLLENPHQTTITMWPDVNKAAADAESERRKLRHLHSELSSDAKEVLRERIRQLDERQASVEDANILPKVTLADVPTSTEKLDREQEVIAGTQFNYFAQPTNGLFYSNVVYDLAGLSASEIQLLPYFTEFLLEFGAGGLDYTAVQQRRAKLGSFSAYASARNHVQHIDQIAGRLVLSAKCLVKHSGETLNELSQILSNARFDETRRALELIVQERADAEASIVDRGHELAMLGAATCLTPSASLDDYWQGPANILRTQQFENELNVVNGAENLLGIFNDIRQKLINGPCQVLCVGEQATLNDIRRSARDTEFSASAPGALESDSFNEIDTPLKAKQTHAWLTTSQVNFCAKAYPVVPPGDDAMAALLVLSKYLQDGFLHPAIRETGGAYGSGAQYDAESSTFRFFSYRDPRLVETFNDFDRSVHWLADNDAPDRLQESILGVIRQLDKPKTPAGAALSTFYDELDGVGYAFRRALRERVLGIEFNDVLEVANRFLSSGGELSAVCDSTRGDELKKIGLAPKKIS
ncbi:MAG: insulinase family protein, partial [Pseudomonadota bacterium]